MAPPVLLIALLVTLLAISGVVIAVGRRWYVQAVLSLVFVGAVLLFVVGFQRLVDRVPTNDTAGIVLTGIALAVGLAVGIAARLLYPGDPSGSAEPGTAPQRNRDLPL